MAEHDDILIHIKYIREAVDGVNGRLDVLNSRTRKVENKVSVLEDRSDAARRISRNWGAGAGAAIGGAMIAAWKMLSGQ